MMISWALSLLQNRLSSHCMHHVLQSPWLFVDIQAQFVSFCITAVGERNVRWRMSLEVILLWACRLVGWKSIVANVSYGIVMPKHLMTSGQSM